MPTRPAKVPWARDPHTAAKHEIYRLYLTRWFPILIRARGFNGDVTYAEGFAGPGVYEGLEPGSPVIALRVLRADASLRDRVKKVRMLFVDADERCTELLGRRLEASPPAMALDAYREHAIDVRVVHGECEPALERLLDETGAWGHPMLVVLDTFGGAVSARLVARVAGNPAGEVIVTFQPQYFARFAETGVTEGDAVFGDTVWRAVESQPSATKARWLLDRYRETVRRAGFAYVLDFELVDARGQALYLVFATNSQLGLRKMKEVVWEVDDVAGVRYRDPRDPDQETLAIELEPQTSPLRRLLRDHLATLPEGTARVSDLRAHALFETVYKESQVVPAVQRMADDGTVELSGGGPVRIGSTIRLSRGQAQSTPASPTGSSVRLEAPARTPGQEACGG